MQEVRHDIPIQYSLWCPWETNTIVHNSMWFSNMKVGQSHIIQSSNMNLPHTLNILHRWQFVVKNHDGCQNFQMIMKYFVCYM
jgi:hypothetical protein